MRSREIEAAAADDMKMGPLCKHGHPFYCGWCGPASSWGADPEPADRRVIAWMPTEYMEAARAAQGKPDALQVALSLGCWYCGSRDPCGCREEADSAIWGADASKPVDLACACPDCVDGPEAKPEPECGVWLISPASLPTSLRSGPENGKGKARTRTMVYDFEEVP